jgi:SRSO17 transposase
VQFQTKIQIAAALLRGHQERGIFHAGWVGCDSFFGVDADFRDAIAAMGKTYLAGIKSNTKVWLYGRLCSAADLASQTVRDWQRVTLAEGAKGPITAEVASIRVSDNRDEKPGVKQWLILRRLEDGRLKYYLSNASEHAAASVLYKALVRRWPIEQCFEDGKKHLGMDHYENRSWNGWHRHMLYVMLAMLFLLRLRLRFKKNADAHLASAAAAADRLPAMSTAG